jgi:hypothetical protein
VLHVLNRDARARRFAFQVLGTGCKYHLAVESAEERERWVKGLENFLFGPPQLGIVYEHQVRVIPNCHSERLQLSGRYVVRITDSHIALFTSTGTLPTRFLYSLSDITRTRYTNFTNDGQKFSVLVLYCNSDETFNTQTQQQNGSCVADSAQCGSRGNRMMGDRGMFVFQTQSASAMSRTIDHRAREKAKRDGQRKCTPPSQTLNSPLSLSAPSPRNPTQVGSLPATSATPLHEEEPLLVFDDQCVNKPCTRPRPARRSMPTKVRTAIVHNEVEGVGPRVKVADTSAKSTLLPQQTSTESVPKSPEKVRVKKTPVPLPRKKHSLDSSQNEIRPVSNLDHAPRAKRHPVDKPDHTSRAKPHPADKPDYASRAKLRPTPPPKPKQHVVSSVDVTHYSSDTTPHTDCL